MIFLSFVISAKIWPPLESEGDILNKPLSSRSFKEDDEGDGKASSALGSLGLKPKPAI